MTDTFDFEYDEYILGQFLLTFRHPNTQRDYRREIMQFMKYIKKPFNIVERDDCLSYIEWLLERAALPKFEPLHLSMATVEKKYSYLMKFYTYLESYSGMCNFFYTIEKPVFTRELAPEKVVPKVELYQLVDQLKEGPVRDYAALMLAFTSGLWSSEICALRWNRLLEDESGNKGIFFAGADGEKRFVKIHPDVYELLMDYWEELGRPPKDHHIFISKQNKPLSERGLRFLMEEACRKAGLPKSYTVRDLRHTGAILAMKNGATEEELQEQYRYLRKNYAERYMRKIPQLERAAVDHIGMSFKK